MILCLECGSHQPAGTPFCDQCGAPLPEPGTSQEWACPTCDARPEPGSNFCDMCGSPLKGAAEPTPAPRPASMPTRLVTIQGRLVVQATGAAIPL
ncbi:MAG: zinc ribbon domain-containing protein, partial [Anaerolineae bacterium]